MKKIMFRVISLIIVALTVVNMLPMAVFAIEAAEPTENKMKLSVSSVTAMPGETVDVTVNLLNNPGISSLKINVSYDKVLQLSDITFNSEFGAYVTAPTPYSSPQTITFISPLEDVHTSGVFATLKFTIASDVSDNYDAAITITYNPEDIMNGGFDEIPMDVENGKITVVHGIAGDINGDKKVNIKDAILLFRYIANWSVAVDEGALDVTGDGKVNIKDAITLFRYISNWDVEIFRGPQTVCKHLEVVLPAVAPTCTTDGKSEGKKCSACNKVLAEQTVVKALGHKYVNGVCAVCGEKEPGSSSYISFRIPLPGVLPGPSNKICATPSVSEYSVIPHSP